MGKRVVKVDSAPFRLVNIFIGARPFRLVKFLRGEREPLRKFSQTKGAYFCLVKTFEDERGILSQGKSFQMQKEAFGKGAKTEMEGKPSFVWSPFCQERGLLYLCS